MPLLPRSLFSHLGLSAAETERMPARVRQLVIAEEARSERLISWVQLAMAVTFAALYIVSPRPADAAPGLGPVPVALGLYGLFTLARLICAYNSFLPGWLLLVSMVADIAILYGLIWSFHIAYAQPAPFYLKIPTFAYTFVFIAVRALRVDPRFVLTQGAIAAFGWIVMVAYAVEEAGSQAITRSFVAYLTDNLILIGAEFDKIVAITLVSLVLALALRRDRQTLFAAVTEGAASSEMRRYFGTGVADAITSRDEAAMAGEAEGRDAAIVMLDLRNFTPFAASANPVTVVETLTHYHRIVMPVIEAHGGVVDKFLGDGVMATFGALSPSSSAAADALMALTEIMDRAPRFCERLAEQGLPPLPIHGAAVAGRVVAATVGTDARLEFTVIGGAANLAAKLEKHNKTTGTAALTTADTYTLARAQGYERHLEPLEPSIVAGVEGPLHLFRLA